MVKRRGREVHRGGEGGVLTDQSGQLSHGIHAVVHRRQASGLPCVFAHGDAQIHPARTPDQARAGARSEIPGLVKDVVGGQELLVGHHLASKPLTDGHHAVGGRHLTVGAGDRGSNQRRNRRAAGLRFVEGGLDKVR